MSGGGGRVWELAIGPVGGGNGGNRSQWMRGGSLCRTDMEKGYMMILYRRCIYHLPSLVTLFPLTHLLFSKLPTGTHRGGEGSEEKRKEISCLYNHSTSTPLPKCRYMDSRNVANTSTVLWTRYHTSAGKCEQQQTVYRTTYSLPTRTCTYNIHRYLHHGQ